MWLKVIVGSALLAGFVPTLLEMAREWWTDTYAVHGMFVPLFAAHLLWTDRARLQDAAGPGDSRAILPIAAAILLLGSGYAAGSLLLRGIGFVIAIASMVYWLAGPRFLRAAAFPLAFLTLMIPLPHAIVATVTMSLQRFAAGFAGAVLELVRVPSYQQGVHIFLPGITLEIAEICNGLRFLLALLVLTLAFAELTLPNAQRKALLVLSVFPVAIVANATRVAVVALAAHYWGPEAASGPIHHGIGKAVWILTIVPMGLIAFALNRVGSSPPAPAEEPIAELTDGAT